MARNKVIESIEAPGGARCVDIFWRSDGSWGFEEYRRDPEENHGWYPIGHFAGQRYATREMAQHAAEAAVPWLASLT